MSVVPARPDDLVDRRASLLADGPSKELDEATDRLRAMLSDPEPIVRRVTDRDRLADLLRREPVHPVEALDFDAALTDRTDVDRRVFELAHPAIEGRPLNVVWVALCRGVPRSMEEILDDRPALDPSYADAAVFWSIWNAEVGLTGLRRGGDLIIGAADLLRSELAGITTFVTLSPVPGLRRWMSERSDGGADSGAAPTTDRALIESASAYLRSFRSDGRPLDPVARFHLGNGARLWRILPDADSSPRGQERSYGVMVNYRYEPEDRTANRALLASGTVAVGPEVPT